MTSLQPPVRHLIWCRSRPCQKEKKPRVALRKRKKSNDISYLKKKQQFWVVTEAI